MTRAAGAAVGGGLLAHAGALLLGGLVALASTAVHRVDVRGLPLGLLLAVGATLATAWHLRAGARPRAVATFGAAWLAVLGASLLGRPEGDVAVAGDVHGYALMATGFVLVGVGVASLAAGTPRRSPYP